MLKKGRWLYIILYILIILLSPKKKSNKPLKGSDFPVPDPSRGQALGFDFNKGEYKYHEDYVGPGEKPRKKKLKKDKDTYVAIDDLLDYYGY